MNLDFIDGRAEVDLADGTRLSIINLDRQPILARARAYDPILWLAEELTVHADADTFEVALINADDEDEGPGRRIPGWDAYVADRPGQWTTYGYVPMRMIDEYVEKIGLARERDDLDDRLDRLAANPAAAEEFRTAGGRVLTDDDIQALADEAERGYDVDRLRRRD